MLGYSEKEILNIPREAVIFPNDLKKDKIIFEKLLSGEIKNHIDEKRYINKNGDVLWCLVSVSLIKNDINQPIHFLAQKINITESKKSEYKINSLLETTKKQNKRLLNFAHIVSHNLRSHSSNFTMLLKMMQEEYPKLSSNPYYPLLKVASENLNETIENLNQVALVNISSNESYSKINLRNIVEKNIANISTQIIEHNVDITNSVPEHIKLNVIPAYANSVILNVLLNTIKYRKENVKPVIKIYFEQVGKYATLNIKDNGLGIDLEKNGDKLFGMYKTFHKNKDSRGLGLFLSKNQIEAMEGKINVNSKVDVGSTFSIYFRDE